MQNWKKEILSIPNLLSLFRLLLIPVYTVMFMQAEALRDYWLAAGVLAVSCLTDLIDGKIARKYNMVTKLGIILDPLADKATQLTLLICLTVKHPILWTVLSLFLVKEGFMLIMGIVNFHRGKMLAGALMSGKICTTVLFVSMTLMVLFPHLPGCLLYSLIGLCMAVLLIAFGDYIRVYLGKDSAFRDVDIQ